MVPFSANRPSPQKQFNLNRVITLKREGKSKFNPKKFGIMDHPEFAEVYDSEPEIPSQFRQLSQKNTILDKQLFMKNNMYDKSNLMLQHYPIIQQHT